MEKDAWHGKPYYSLDAFFKNTYGEKIYKIAVDAGLTCPNRDGTLGSRGCTFCSAGGSGDFAVQGYEELRDTSVYGKQYEQRSGRSYRRVKDVDWQIEQGLARFRKKAGQRFVIYFQAYTGTYGPVDYLREIWTRALENPQVVGISVATRPDCLFEEVLALLRELAQIWQPEGKFIWIELGLQTMHEKTAETIRRGYALPVYADAVTRLHETGIPTITHIILGLPGETEADMLATVSYVNRELTRERVLPGTGVKLQLLHVLEGTDLAEDYRAGRFVPLSMEKYMKLVKESLALLSPELVIHRLTGDGPKQILLAPAWSANKRMVLNTMMKYLHQSGNAQAGEDSPIGGL